MQDNAWLDRWLKPCIEFGVGADHAVYLQALLRDHLRYHPEDFLVTRDEALDRILYIPTSQAAAR